MPVTTGTNVSSKIFRRLTARTLLRRWIAKLDVPGWRTFLISMMALALAFVLAMYSSVFAQQGRVIATGLCAGAALLLAGYVAFTAIPYLARRTRIEWLHVSLDYKLTREGWAFIVLILLLAIAGLNTGNNLLYMILSSLLAAILMSGILSLGVLSGVGVDIELPQHVFARQPVRARVRLSNLKKVFPSFSLTLRGSAGLAGASISKGAMAIDWKHVFAQGLRLGSVAATFTVVVLLALWKVIADFYRFSILALVVVGLLTLGASLILAMAALALAQWKTLAGARSQTAARPARRGTKPSAIGDVQARRGILDQPLYFPFLPRGSAIERQVEIEFPRRGHYRDDHFDLSTRFPFGFLDKTMHLGLSRELLVYPAVRPNEKLIEILPMLSGELEAFQKGMGHDLYSIREMLGSDSVRHVDWKASARSGSLKVREFAREDDRRVQLVLDPRIGKVGDAPGTFSAEALTQFEAAVEFCACLAWHFHEMDAEFQFVCGDFRTPVARASEIIYDILRHLAVTQPSVEAPDSALAVSEQDNLFRIICASMKKNSLPASPQSYLVYFEALAIPPARN